MGLQKGSQLGPYEILALIGAGGMGEVYRARDTRLGRDVAVKVLPAEASEKAERVRRFAQEARAAGALNHPNILSVYDVGEQDGAPYLVTELLEGESLRERLAEGPLPVRKAVAIAARIAEGLAAAHEKGIVHRDLKPGNVFLTKDGRVKILDFGLARLLQDAWGSGTDSKAPTAEPGTRPGLIVGTMGYMSPEQVKGKPADARSDLFALGVMLYEMLSGKRPFTGDSDAEIMTAILKEDPPPLDAEKLSLPPLIERTVAHCLEKNPARRFQSAQDIVFALDTVTSASGISKALPPLPEETRRRRLKWMAAALALALAGAGLASAGLLLGKQRYTRPIPSYKRLTFRRGLITTARFSPDGNTVYYSAAWGGKDQEIFSKRLDTIDSQSMNLKHMQVLAVSSGEMAVFSRPPHATPFTPFLGTLAKVSLSGGTPRSILEQAYAADYQPGTNQLAVVKTTGDGTQLEFPIGKRLCKSKGVIQNPRFAPDGMHIAFIEHPGLEVEGGKIVVTDLKGNRRVLAASMAKLTGLSWGPDGSQVWFTGAPAEGRCSLFKVNMRGRIHLIANSAADPVLYDASAEGRALLLVRSVRMESRGMVAGDTKERDLSWMDGTFIWHVSEDGETLVFDEFQEGGGPANSVYLLRVHDGPPVRLAEGYRYGSLSPDGKRVLVLDYAGKSVVLLPTGPGRAVTLPAGPIEQFVGARWVPNSDQVLVGGMEANRVQDCYLQRVPDGRPRRLAKEPVWSVSGAVSPDGKYFPAFPVGARRKLLYALYPLDGGPPKEIPGIKVGEHVLGFNEKGTSIYVREAGGGAPVRVVSLNLSTGRRTPWKFLAPSDPAGVLAVDTINIAPNGQFYTYSFLRTISELFLIEDLE